MRSPCSVGAAAAEMARTARSSCSLDTGAMGTACPGVFPPLRRRDGDGHSVVREKGEGDEKSKLEGKGVEKKRRDEK